MAILDHRGNPVQSKQLTKELAAPTLSGIRTVWSDQVTAGLTPYRLAIILKGAAEGDIRDFLTLAEEMEERDLHYRCEISKRRLAVSSLPIVVEAASDDEKDIAMADDVQSMLKKAGFKGLLKDLLDALGKGYSVCEIMWQKGAKWVPRKYEWRDPRFFTFDQESRRQLRLLDPADGVNGIELAAYKYLVHFPHLKTGIPIRGGIARVAAWAYLFKNYTAKDWMAFAEVFGMPLRLGKYQPGASQEDINVLKMAVANLGSDAAAVIPDSMLIDFIESGKSTGGDTLFMRLADWLDAQVSRGILGQTATTQGTPGKLGSEDVQAEVRDDIRDDDATQLSETINRDLVVPYIDLNYGPQEHYPEFVLRAVENEDLTVLTTALEKLVPLGLRVDQQEVRDKLGMKDPEKDAELLQPPSKEVEKQEVQPAASAKNQEEAGGDLEGLLFSYARSQSAGPAFTMIEEAAKLLDSMEDLEEFRERLIDLFHQSDPELLAEVFARVEILSNLSGRLEVENER